MKSLLVVTLLLFSNLCLAEIALYTAESNSPHEIQEMGDILEKFTKESPDKNLLFYVHGRNHTVDTEWKKLKTLESTYNVRVVMLHWDAWSGVFSRAVHNASIASESLSVAFNEISEFREGHAEYFETHKINLLCHSMGNLVLKDYVEGFSTKDHFDSQIFDSYIGVSADVPLVDHKNWLTSFTLAKSKVIVMNNRDIVLMLSYGLDLTQKNPFYYRLGLGFDNWPGKRDKIKEKLDNQATYIDLSGVLESQHGYFMPKTKVLKTIFQRLTNGEPFDLNPVEKSSLKIKVKTENNIFYVKDS